ncbi:DNA excision repair protein ERCC-1 [Spea bombifrons]|uniref:DNA excision repair protein ERCC-1 n=1 Tax=Spea bombifrons TaxID=233779 RepID=UPI00234B84A1|nr:DNA excision repair protein ERCC-1 [Spea bombifrons]
MESHQEEKKTKETEPKNFIIPSQLPELSQVRSLFQAPTAVSAVPAASGQSYADYVFRQEPRIPKQPAKNSDPREDTALPKGQLPTTATKPGGGRSCIVVSTRQKGNPLLKHVRNVPWEFGDIVPDYLLGETCCALFLSLRYHNLNPEYIHTRLQSLGQSYALRVLLVQVDVKDPHFALKELAKICILSDCTLILSWSPDEAARYLETYKCYEQKPADALKERTERDFMSRMMDCLTTIRSVNKTDSCTLISTFGTLADVANASREDLSLCPGLGPQKAKRLFDTLHEPFMKPTMSTCRESTAHV